MSSEPGFGVFALFFFHFLHLQPVSLALLPYKADRLSCLENENGDLPSSSCTPCTRYVEVRQFLLDVICIESIGVGLGLLEVICTHQSVAAIPP